MRNIIQWSDEGGNIARKRQPLLTFTSKNYLSDFFYIFFNTTKKKYKKLKKNKHNSYHLGKIKLLYIEANSDNNANN